MSFLFFFFNDTATTEIYTLSLHDALPICADVAHEGAIDPGLAEHARQPGRGELQRSEEHTSELQSPCNLVCRLLLEKKKSMHRGGLSLRLWTNWRRLRARSAIRPMRTHSS